MKLTVIIPIYNKQRYIADMLEQLREQTFSDYECLLIDDGSSDGSEKICDTFAARDHRFSVFHIPNGGVSHARNVGIENAAGEYITFIDGDDELLPNYLENLYACIMHSSADMVVSGCLKFWDHKPDTVSVKHPLLAGLVDRRDWLSSFASVQKSTGLFGYCWAKLFRRDLLGDIRFDEGLRLAEDFDFYLRLYAKVQRLYFDDHCLYRYRQAAENSSTQIKDDKIDYFSQLRINLRYREFLRKEGVYQGENQRIVAKLLSDYLYFCVFYCPQAEMDGVFPKLAKVQKDEEIELIPGRGLQNIVMPLLSRGRYKMAAAVLRFYRFLRNVIRRSK